VCLFGGRKTGQFCAAIQPFFGNQEKVPFFNSWDDSSAGYPGDIMMTLQAILLGAMLGWTPSVVVLAVLLRDIPEREAAD
jgi:hypothetical protein